MFSVVYVRANGTAKNRNRAERFTSYPAFPIRLCADTGRSKGVSRFSGCCLTVSAFSLQVKHAVSNRCLARPSARGSLNQPMGPVGTSACDVDGRPSLSLMFVMAPDEGLDSAVWSGPLMTDESVCVDTPELDAADGDIALKVRVVACTGRKRQRWTYDAEVRAGPPPTTRHCTLFRGRYTMCSAGSRGGEWVSLFRGASKSIEEWQIQVPMMIHFRTEYKKKKWQ